MVCLLDCPTNDGESVLLAWYYLIELQLQTRPKSSINDALPWSFEEDRCLWSLFYTALSVADMEDVFQGTRSRKSIEIRLSQLRRDAGVVVPRRGSRVHEIYCKGKSEGVAISTWLARWINKRASDMASKDSRLRNAREYTAEQTMPKVLDAWLRAPDGQCCFCRRHLVFNFYGRHLPVAASLDHAIAETPLANTDNWLALSCRMCNQAKHTLSLEEFMDILDLIRHAPKKRISSSLSRKDKMAVEHWHSKCCQEDRKLFNNAQPMVDKDTISKQALVSLAVANGAVCPFTNIQASYVSGNGGWKPLALSFGRRKKMVRDDVNGGKIIHGFYDGNVVPMLGIIRFASFVYTDTDVHAWVQAIRRSVPLPLPAWHPKKL